jgi:hypothetical protein
MTVCLMILAAAPAEGSITLAVYGDGRALVTEVRDMSLPPSGEVEFKGVPETLQPTTLTVRSLTAPQDFSLVSSDYERDLIGRAEILQAYLGKQVTVVLPDRNDAEAKVERRATILSVNDGAVLRLDNGEVYLGPFESVIVPEVPEGLRPDPALVWNIENLGPSLPEIEVGYLAEQISWSADYTLGLARDSKRAVLAAWASIDNQSGADFRDAEILLMAGKPARAGGPPRPQARLALSAEAADAGPEREKVFEYHVYDLGRRLSLEDRETRQAALIAAREVEVSRELVSDYGAASARGGRIEQPVQSLVVFDNTEKSGLGLPLPAGTVRAYQEDSKGRRLFIGEQNMDHSPVGGDVRLRLGMAFDVSVERRLLSEERLGRNVRKLTWEIAVQNGGDETRSLLLRETLSGDWRIESASQDYEKLDANRIGFKLDVPPTRDGEAKKVEYTVVMEF